MSSVSNIKLYKRSSDFFVSLPVASMKVCFEKAKRHGTRCSLAEHTDHHCTHIPMTSSDSLFDNTINSDPSLVSKIDTAPTAETGDVENIMENDSIDLDKSLITYRVLVSRREAGAIIGKEGSNITKIRDEFDIKAGVSKVVDGCIDRILTITGKVENIADALVNVAQFVLDANLITIEESEANGTSPLRLINYEYPPLRPLSLRPNYKSEEYQTNLFLRLLIPNSQIGTLIGKGGERIRAIQEDNDIKMVASKEFLDNSNERSIELQGTFNNLRNALYEISKYLLRDYQGTSSITFYHPSSPLEPRFNRNNVSNVNNMNNINREDPRIIGKEIIKKISFPNEYIGALIGKRGSRIQEIRNQSHCAVAIENESENENEREITLVGTKLSVDKAIDLLNMYYQREQKRRLMADEE